MRTPHVSLSCLAAAAALLGPFEASAQGSLTLAQAQRLALERSRQVAAIQSGVDASRERAAFSRRLPDPVLSLSIENVPLERIPPGQPGLHPGGEVASGVDRFSLTDDSMTMRRVGLAQELTARGKRDLRAQRFELEASRGQAEAQAASASIRRESAIAWLDTWHFEEMARLVAEQRVRGLQEVQAAEAQYRAGRGSQPDLLLARTNLAMLDDRAAQVERSAKTARVMLARWAGDAGLQPLAAPPAIERVDFDSHGLEERLAAHPDIDVLAKQHDVLSTDARLAAANRIPDWTLEVAYSQRGSQYGDMVSLGVRVPLPWDLANRQDREVAARLAEAKRAEALRDEALREHVAQVRTMLQEWETNRGRIARYEREIVPLAAARAEALLAAFRGGKSSVSEVLGARRAELEARLESLQLQAETARLWARLTFLGEEAR